MSFYCANQSYNQFYLVISLRFQCAISSSTYYMHMKPEAELLPLNTELERTLKSLKKVRVAEEATMAEHKEGSHYIPIVVTDRPRQR